MRVREGLVGTAVAHLEAFLLEPEGAAPAESPDPGTGSEYPPIAVGPRPVIAVLGLARRCGCTLVARALASELAVRDPEGAAAVAAERRTPALPLAGPAARRLARLLAEVPHATTTAAGRLCLVDGVDSAALADTTRALAPLVLDRGTGPIVSGELGFCDGVVLVAAPGVEWALAEVAEACLRRAGARVLQVRNACRAGSAEDAGAERLAAGAELRLPFTRAGARLALAGYPPGGELGRAVARLAGRCQGLA